MTSTGATEPADEASGASEPAAVELWQLDSPEAAALAGNDTERAFLLDRSARLRPEVDPR